MSMLALINEMAVMLLQTGTSGNDSTQATGFLGAVSNGVMIVGIGMIGWASIKAAQEGDIWNAATRIVLGGVTLAFIVSGDFRNTVIELMNTMVGETFGGK